MSFVDAQILWKHGGDTTDISSITTSYTREQNICTGIGTLNVTIDYASNENFRVWDRIVLYEEGHKRGTYFIAEDVKSVGKGSKQLVCQDASKKLTDYFIVESYYIDYASYTRYWIEKFMTDATVDYQFETASSGVLLSNNSSLGKASAYDTIQTLLQQSGWYMYVDNDNKFHIGNLNKDLTHPQFTFNNNRILSINTNKNDKYLRNRAVVWGESNQEEWVYADVSRHTPWDHGEHDQRTVVLSNGNIHSSSVAYDLAQKLLDEFATIDYIKELEISGYSGVEIGDVVRVKSKGWSGVGLVTKVGSSLSSSGGLRTQVTLDERCPRLFGYFGFYSYVYIGTNGAGVWRKELDHDLWEAFSTGLDQYNVTDLMVKAGVFACTSGGFAYINLNPEVADWQKYNPGGFTDIQEFGAVAYSEADVDAVACDIDDQTLEIYFGYRLKESVAASIGTYLSWVDIVNSDGERIAQYQVRLDVNKKSFKLVDVDKFGSNVMPTAEGPSSYAPDEILFGYRRSYPEPVPCTLANTYGPLPDENPYEDAIKYVSSEFGVKCDVDIEGSTITITNAGYDGNGPHRLLHFEFDENDVQYKAEKRFYSWPVTFYGNAESGLTLLDRIIARDPTISEGGSEEEDTGRYYNIYDVVKYYTNYHAQEYIYLYSARISPLIARPVYHDPVQAASTSNILLSIFVPGPATLDGVTTYPGMRVLLKDQTDSRENGIYVVTGGMWVRATDADQNAEMIRGLFVNVAAGGTINGGKAFQLDIDEDATVSIGSTEFTFTEVLILESVGSSLILDANGAFDSWGASDFPHSVRMINGTLYIFMQGTKTEAGTTIPNLIYYLGICGQGGTTTQQIASSPTASEAAGDFWRYGNTLFLPCGNGCAVIRTKEQVHDIGDTPSNATVYLEAFIVDGVEVTFTSKMLIDVSDAILGDWRITHNPVHGAGWGIAQLALLGYNLDDGISPYVGFKATVNASGMWQCCFSGTCGGGLVVAVDTEDKFSFGVLNVFTMEFISKDDYARATTYASSCMASSYDEWDYDKYNFNFLGVFPTSCRGQNPRFVYNGNEVWDAVLFEQVGTMDRTAVIASHLDDFDGCFYVASGGILYKESPNGGTVAEIRYIKDQYGIPGGPIFGGNGRLIVTNGLIISHNVYGGDVGGYTVHRFDKDTLFAGMNFCYLTKKTITNTFEIKDLDFYSFRTEENKNTPLMSFTTASGLITYTILGEERHGVGEGHFRDYNTNFRYRQVNTPVNDLRSFDLSTSIYLAGEYTSMERGKYILAAQRDGKVKFYRENQLSSSFTLSENLSALGNTQVGRVETSNYYYPPWFFHSYSGSMTPEFFERSPSASEFTDYSATLPAFDITSIRLDDRM